MSLKKITSLTMMLSILIMAYTGIMLFIAPPGRIANWANWKILGLSKEQYGQVHTTFMVLILVMTILHVFYNWKPITSYMKNKAKQMIVFTKDMLVAVVLTLVFLVGTLTFITPFSSFLEFGDGIKNSWEKEYGTAPYSHAELSSLESFCKKLGFDIKESEKILKNNNIIFEPSQSLSQIADDNSVSPQFIYNLLKVNFEKNGQEIIELTGLGRKTVKEVASTLKLSTDEFISKLKALGVDASSEDKFKQVAEKYDMSPMDIMIKLGYKKPE
ncbi:DUF4405 domain-containing protein [Arcobacter arenosus]|uniref:DUF4405 domain-containing protein n=1 Tax=Arcobacter arenosus TaxID=2576037 RepID=UPI003BAD33CF